MKKYKQDLSDVHIGDIVNIKVKSNNLKTILQEYGFEVIDEDDEYFVLNINSKITWFYRDIGESYNRKLSVVN